MKMVRLTMVLTMARMMVMKMMMKMVRLTFMSLPLAIFVQHAAQGCGARHVVRSILAALLRYCLRSTMSLLAPPPRGVHGYSYYYYYYYYTTTTMTRAVLQHY